MADPKIRFDILANAQGAGEVSQLANELEKLDGSLDPALAARAKETADQLREVGRQQEAINTFRQLKAASSDTAAALNQAQAQAQALAREIAASGMPTRNQTGQMEKLRDAVRAAKDAHTESVQKLQQHRQAMADAGVETVNLSAQQAELSTRQKALRTDAGEIAGKYREQAEAAKASASTQAQAVARVADGNDKLGKSAGGATELVKGLASALAAGFTFNELVQAAAQMEAIKAGLQAVTGSADQAGKEFDFVRQVATRVGADVTQVGQAFLGLAAATRGTAVEGEPTRQVFEAVAAAMGKTGKSSSETQNALVALAQMASKGAVSMEELRGQLGEALPGALQAAASGLGITTQDLIKLVEQGKIAAEDLFPALTKGLNELYGSGGQGAQTLAQEITNIKNQFVELANNIGEAGGLDALKTGAEVAQMSLVLLDDTLVRTGKTIGVVAAAIASMDFSGLPAAFEEIEKEGRDKLLKAAAHNETLRKSLQLSSDEAMKSALAQQASGQSVKAAGEEAERAGASYTQLSSAYQKVSDYVKAQIDASEQSRIAREAEGKASVALAQAFGTESEKRGAVAAAAQTDADELMKIALLRQTEADVMRAELAAKQELIDKNNTDSDQRRKEIEELKQKIDATQTAADKAIALAQASQLASAQAKAEADATRDNSGRVVELASAYEEARKKVEALRLAKSAGQDVSEKLRVAEIEAGKAAILYKDALADQFEAPRVSRRLQHWRMEP
ncbi:tape measure protein [Aquabacterium sp.]|uniref:tape measure protein n=1 Tax=Aquabacterium sp. TaxID=1872578 RepID=UPI0035B24428